MRLVRDEVTVTAPATCANLGPGFDAFGLAVAIHDVVQVRATTGATRVEVSGAGAGQVPTDDEHLVVHAMRLALDQVGAPQAGLELRCHNAIPHGRGLGSSAAAVVAGLVAVRNLISEPEALDDQLIVQLATELEGHPDNAAPALHGGATIAWLAGGHAHVAGLPVHPEVRISVLIPPERLSTSRARAALPRTVAHAEAAANAGRAGLLTLALSTRPDLLFAATEDWLHQRYRADVMPQSLALLHQLRAAGLPAVVSGAGPTLLVFDHLPAGQLTAIPPGWRVRHPAIDTQGTRADRA